MEVTRELAAQVLHQLEAKGNDLNAVNQQIAGLSADEQKQFFAQAAQKLEIGSAQTSSAIQAFQEGAAGASYIPDVKNPLTNKFMLEGKQQYANPVSTVAALASGGLKGATELPIAGNIAAAGIQKATGTSPEQYAQFEQAAQEQHPIASAVGEGLGALVMQPVLIEGAAKGIYESAKAAGQAMKAATGAVGSATLKGASKVLAWTGSPTAAKVAAILSDKAAMTNPQTVKLGLDDTSKALRVIGDDLAKNWKAVDPAVPAEIQLTKADLWSHVETSVKQQAVEGGRELTNDALPKLKRQFDRLVTSGEQAPIKPSQLWSFAKNAAEESGKYRAASKFNPAAGSRAEVLDALDQLFREKLYDYATQATTLNPQAQYLQKLSQQADLYGKVKNSNRIFSAQWSRLNKPELQQEGLAAAHKVLGMGPEKLGKNFNKLEYAARYGSTALLKAHTNLLLNNADYRQALSTE